MSDTSLAVKYRPSTWSDVTEQDAIKITLQKQVEDNRVVHGLLFCGGAGTGKTTSARIYATEINRGSGKPIELDAASHNSVDNIREIIEQARSRALDGEYKVFILDEVHALSSSAWQAMLKILEEPPEKVIFIMCTTNPEKIPSTILSRVQRYDFRRISYEGILNRLKYILSSEIAEGKDYHWDEEALSYISKVSGGGLRDAITSLDKCLSYSHNLTVDNVVKALGITGYDEMFKLLEYILDKNAQLTIEFINRIYMDGIDLKQYMKQFTAFVLDICKYQITNSFLYVKIPNTYESQIKSINQNLNEILDMLVSLNSDLRYDTTPKETIESTILLRILS